MDTLLVEDAAAEDEERVLVSIVEVLLTEVQAYSQVGSLGMRDNRPCYYRNSRI